MTEISEEETMITLEDYYVPLFEFRNNLFVSYGGIRALALLSAKYLPNLCLPDKAIRLLEEVGAFVKNHSNDILIEEKHIRKVLSDKTQIPLENLQNQEKEKLLNLEQLLRARVVGQEEGISELASALRRSAVQVNTKRGPIGSFLFLGSTGVGKTETAKALADIYFGSEQKMIRLDMSEFQNPQDTEKILGDFENPGPFITLVRENPFSLVLIDEIEKAHPNILNLFLQILDEGWITDGVGKKVDFQNTIIIATSNAGSEIIRQDVNLDKNLNLLKSELLNIIMQQGLFKPELINRFDGVVVFRPLTLENLMEIAQMQLKKVAEQLKDKGIILEITRELKEKIAQISYSPTFGAREMRRILQDKVENSLAKVLLAGIIKRGDTIQISPIDFNVIKI
ncbi:MAG: AAA family ATPase [Candidatus Gribaldobacteria bacterium]|nr:AAA family ATPase [Candidatus Gribaldobacteria bacterium]